MFVAFTCPPGGSLPATGTDAVPLFVVALVLVGIGASVLVLARWSRRGSVVGALVGLSVSVGAVIAIGGHDASALICIGEAASGELSPADAASSDGGTDPDPPSPVTTPPTTTTPTSTTSTTASTAASTTASNPTSTTSPTTTTPSTSTTSTASTTTATTTSTTSTTSTAATTTSTTSTTVAPSPDLTPVVDVTPAAVPAVDVGVPATVNVAVQNLAPAGPSLGPVEVRVPKDSRISGVSLAAGPGWTLDSTTLPSDYILTYSPVIVGSSSSSTSQLAFTFTPGPGFTGYPFTATIPAGSGGDSTSGNNVASDLLGLA